MGKIQQYSKRAEIRKNRILSCETCKGNPITAETNLQGIRCTYCETCMEVINYNQVGQLLTNKIVTKNIEEEAKDRGLGRVKKLDNPDDPLAFLKTLR